MCRYDVIYHFLHVDQITPGHSTCPPAIFMVNLKKKVSGLERPLIGLSNDKITFILGK